MSATASLLEVFSKYVAENCESVLAVDGNPLHMPSELLLVHDVRGVVR